MPEFQLTNTPGLQKIVGRGVVFVAGTSEEVEDETVFTPGYWDGTGPIEIRHAGDTEGEIVLNPNLAFGRLQFPELTGDATVQARARNGAATVEIPFFTATPFLQGITNPMGTHGMGTSRAMPVLEYTLVIFPEFLLFDRATREYKAITYEDGAWELDGEELTADQERLLGLSTWVWRCFPQGAPRRYRDEDEGKVIETVTFDVMLDETKPEGHMLWTHGDPNAHGIDLEGEPEPET
jgi:hypothetical protein